MIPVGAPPRVQSLLRTAPDGPLPVLHRGRDAVYVDVAGSCVGVVSRRATAVPCALRTGTDAVPLARTAHLDAGVLHLDDEPLAVGRVVDVSVPRLATTWSRPAPLPGVVAEMVGRGDGLTPYDDDVLCGWLAIHRAAGVETPEADAAVRAHLGRTTLLSATLLDCAMHGEVIPEFAAWVADPSRADALVAVGHTSGRGLLEGARFALDAQEGAA
ncbi:DUF2877 domain-containing protein [Nocardioides sp. MAH-18]|uniref:DUF2877 domain-containing protein n=1 Tax=Nocardioides agri TaxID=2682843 RepID=A0A6L6XQB3_9ACTN|nr:DUF2877 domain-containing protein [Nocardioides sp. CGMCC 1.13656]MBA2953904.1 DUF2877 domain-containing protein [Nocardioides sp. CGMCC 1.13656]MVQ48766.1 DUF2877 domain-containing protein [Nocardioides sp. MAH-18]